jgi:AcrR family transcriptional regulator
MHGRRSLPLRSPEAIDRPFVLVLAGIQIPFSIWHMNVVRTRLNRREQQEQTRARIVESAAHVFARRGFARGSLEEIAESAGYSKGAVYSNFASKDELFLAVLDARYDHWLDQVAAALEQEGNAGAGLEAITRVCSAAGSDPDWCLLSVEFWLHAARDERLRGDVVRRTNAIRTRIAELIANAAETFRFEPPAPAETLATAVLALADGFAMQRFGGECDPADNTTLAAMLARLLGIETALTAGGRQ